MLLRFKYLILLLICLLFSFEIRAEDAVDAVSDPFKDSWIVIPSPPPSSVLVFHQNMKVGLIGIPFEWSRQTIIKYSSVACVMQDNSIGLYVNVYLRNTSIENENARTEMMLNDHNSGYSVIEKYDNGYIFSKDKSIMSHFVARGQPISIYIENNNQLESNIGIVRKLRRDILEENERIPR